MEILFNIPRDMDVPQSRRVKTISNGRWLMRNLGVRNRMHPEFDITLALIKDFLKGNP
jgi:hypothetical protein